MSYENATAVHYRLILGNSEQFDGLNHPFGDGPYGFAPQLSNTVSLQSCHQEIIRVNLFSFEQKHSMLRREADTSHISYRAVGL